MRVLSSISLIFGLIVPALFWADDQVAAPASDPPSVQKPAKKSGSKSRTRKKGSAPREKETEGTEALDRFEADTVIKSQYHLDGKQLEVDPD